MKTLEVQLNFSKDQIIKVGRLADDNGKIYFEFHPQFLDYPLELSPFMLPKKAGVIKLSDPTHLKGLWGVFHDSLPDTWGMLLMDRFYKSLRLNPMTISLLDRLLFIGDRATGALTYHPATEISHDKHLIDLSYLNTESQKIVSGKKDEVLPLLLQMGGSPGGARPKIFVGLNSQNDLIHGASLLPHNFEHWIVKFNSKSDLPDSGSVEFAYAQMAFMAGIEMSETKLLQTQKSDVFFATKRFDRKNNLRFHQHTFANLVGTDFRIPSTDYLDLMKTSYSLNKSHLDLEKILRLMIFNIMAHNRDDHAKNFSFIMNHQGAWSFAPAYDLTFSHGPGGEHSNTVMGEGKNPTAQHVYKIADEFAIKKSKVEVMIEQTRFALSQWKDLAKDLGIAKKTVSIVEKHLRSST